MYTYSDALDIWLQLKKLQVNCSTRLDNFSKLLKID